MSWKMKPTITFRNRTLGFALVFPRWWKSYLVVDRKATGDGKEKYLSFRFRYNGIVYDPIFTLHISSLTGNAWKQYYGDSPVMFLREHNGLTYGYLLPGELPSAFLTPDLEEYDYAMYGRPIRILKKLVSQASNVLKTIHFLRRRQSHIAGCRPARISHHLHLHSKRSKVWLNPGLVGGCRCK